MTKGKQAIITVFDRPPMVWVDGALRGFATSVKEAKNANMRNKYISETLRCRDCKVKPAECPHLSGFMLPHYSRPACVKIKLME